MPIDASRPLAVDLFAGAGGLSLGLEQAGYEVAAAVEYDPVHAAVHEFNFPQGKTFCADVSKISGAEIRKRSEIGDREIHLVAGGPPCQGISMIGRRLVDDPRNALLKEFVRIVLELKPRYFLMENVAGLMVGPHRQLLDEVVESFETSGQYDVVTPVRVLQAADYGTPQSRRRTILVGARKDVALPKYPEPTHTPRTIRGSVPKNPALPLGASVSDALGDLPDADLFEDLLHDDNVAGVAYGKTNEYAARLRGSKKDPTDFSRPRPRIEDEMTSSARTVHTKKSIDRFAGAEPGTTETVSRFLRLHPDGLCNTLRAGTATDRGAIPAGGQEPLNCRAQHPADELDPETITMFIDEPDHLGQGRPGSFAKNTLAALRISLALRSSAFSFCSRLISAAASVVSPGITPASTS
ncbi:hypothetical protein O159_17170 [Leifsonia xyli subsp. cynodontis DSM 46306]|uniref:DNA (cytosine-5-)-methyltransferase n=1 Tax=Leifsonia xyli subsp. cynodontis DSM 46306 TaxID=1389489 RepID=U3P8G2_LEIXC|nr:DNA cytosine methyltransferase [Leifsonia xyli]AGW41759.1 hypothetical protein O159_17170 [Leifsonia xyli subsp. cynodontis DSM 46306]